ncbi:hypothetical protein M0802_001782 [Mischocyttarus mexicanus]|nr:hypothetical protein M0802_001782 [Mischocyttarus mexicanus]
MVSGWCPCVPLGRRESPAQQQQQQPPSSSSSSRGFTNDGAPFTVSAATDRAEMVQMFYYENRGKTRKVPNDIGDGGSGGGEFIEEAFSKHANWF